MRLVLAFCLLLLGTVTVAAALRVEPVRIETSKGSFLFQAEVAATSEERGRGLMFRNSLAPDRAMLFDFGKPRPVSLWMKNTYIPLDMIFVGPDGIVVSVAQNAVPGSLDVISSGGNVSVAIEVIAGTAARIGVKKGDRVRHRLFGNGG